MNATLHHVVRPASAVHDNAPVLILLHGIGSNERDMAALAPAIDPRFLVLSVRAPLTLGPDAFAWFQVRFTGQGPTINADQAVFGWRVLTEFVQNTVPKYDGDLSRVYVAGFSQGGIMALCALLTEPELFAGAICMSGRLLPEVLPHAASRPRLAGKPALILHGVSDKKLGIEFARKARVTLEQLGITLTYRELPMGHEITAESLNTVTAWLRARLDDVPPAAHLRD